MKITVTLDDRHWAAIEWFAYTFTMRGVFPGMLDTCRRLLEARR